MKALYCIIFLSLLTFVSIGQTFIRLTDEAPDTFAKRIFKVEKLEYRIIETNEWDANKKIIICFFEFQNAADRGILGFLLTPIEGQKYQQIFIDSFNVSGGIGSVSIETVFFANTDNDKAREIIITTKAEIRPPRYSGINIQGYFYDNYFYDNYNLTFPPIALTKFVKLNDEFSDFEGTTYDNETGKVKKKEKSKYKDPKAIGLKLKKMGY
ncbi:MAG: hypothetical protein CFE25_00495 [Chitinophagaceae bacterium BSSC1]|nr:MAG: hypothetical protein CFE25_00495 [Chitinophagaceae bacterium BSSC1]